MPQQARKSSGNTAVIIAVICLAVAVITAAAVILIKRGNEPKAVTVVPEQPAAETEAGIADEQQNDYKQAYAEVLRENETTIKQYLWQKTVDGDMYYDYGEYEQGDVVDDAVNKCVALADLNNDGTPELLFMSFHDDDGRAYLHIYTCKDGQAFECDYGDMLSDYNVAAGVCFIIYTGKSGSFYIATREGDDHDYYCSKKYSMDPEGYISTVQTITNRYDHATDETKASDVYKINENTVSSEEGIKALGVHREDFSKLLMCAGYSDDFLVFKYVKSKTPAAKCFNDALYELEK
jgi:hypothetical protein